MQRQLLTFFTMVLMVAGQEPTRQDVYATYSTTLRYTLYRSQRNAEVFKLKICDVKYYKDMWMTINVRNPTNPKWIFVGKAANDTDVDGATQGVSGWDISLNPDFNPVLASSYNTDCASRGPNCDWNKGVTDIQLNDDVINSVKDWTGWVYLRFAEIYGQQDFTASVSFSKDVANPSKPLLVGSSAGLFKSQYTCANNACTSLEMRVIENACGTPEEPGKPCEVETDQSIVFRVPVCLQDGTAGKSLWKMKATVNSVFGNSAFEVSMCEPEITDADCKKRFIDGENAIQDFWLPSSTVITNYMNRGSDLSPYGVVVSGKGSFVENGEVKLSNRFQLNVVYCDSQTPLCD